MNLSSSLSHHCQLSFSNDHYALWLMLCNTKVTSHVWLFSAQNMGILTEEPNSILFLIYLNLNGHMKLVATIDCTAERSRVHWTGHMPFRCSFMNNTPHSQTSVKDWEGESSNSLDSKLQVKGRIMCSMCIKKKEV